MTLSFTEEESTDIKALARIRRVSTTDRPAMAALVAGVIAIELDKIAEPSHTQPPATKGEGG